ncbi:MAG: hypothetical protein OSJ72_12705 [Lachnospiraceae bacterium]|nr:hypothetical protein [Lachnospiraceae bacterium]
MSGLQEQAVQMIGNLSDDNVSFLIEIIQRLMPSTGKNTDESMQAFYRLDTAREEIRQYLPKDFDPDKELEEARAERYGSTD